MFYLTLFYNFACIYMIYQMLKQQVTFKVSRMMSIYAVIALNLVYTFNIVERANLFYYAIPCWIPLSRTKLMPGKPTKACVPGWKLYGATVLADAVPLIAEFARY